MGEGDVGENTGGMGAYSPAPVVTPRIEDKIISEILKPTASAMVKEGIPFKGVLFAGLMIQGEKVPKHEDHYPYNTVLGELVGVQCALWGPRVSVNHDALEIRSAQTHSQNL